MKAQGLLSVMLLGLIGCPSKKPPEASGSPSENPGVTEKLTVDLEALCPTADVAGYQVRRGEASGVNAGEAIAAAREQALQSLGRHVCTGVSELRCAAILRHVKPWREGWFDPAGGWACASVSIDRRELDSLEQDAAVFESNLRNLAAAVAERTGRTPVQVKAPTWASGCSSGGVGQAISAGLFNQLASFPDVRLMPSEDRADRAMRVSMELAPGRGGVALTAAIARPTESTVAPLPGFNFPLDLFEIDADERGQCRGDRELGLSNGERLGEGGLRVMVEVPGVDGEACEGQDVEPVVRVNRPADLQVYSVAKDGRSLLVWPPPGFDSRVEGTLSLGTMTAIAQPQTGDERLVVVALPSGGRWEKTDGWHGFCEVAGGLQPEYYPKSAAVGTATFTVNRSGTGDCPAVPNIEALRDKVVLPPACPL
ncbi:MAG: hypothetical protein EA397_01105 [Deltaproteobacteria bacterium]|nr:MAG: hypothetical protein EA397_01105 [Deltaproteobacteria bacterium]